MEKISFEYFKKIEVKIGEIKSAEKIEDTDKLIKLAVDFGEQEVRTIVSGIAHRVATPADLIGKKFPFVTNLEPRMIRGVESNGMIMVASDDQEGFSFIEPSSPISNGARLV